MSNFDRYGKVEINNDNLIIKFHEKEPTKKGLINGGIYYLNKHTVQYLPLLETFSFEKDFLEKENIKISMGGYTEDKYFVDIGVPEDYYKAQLELPLINKLF